MFYVEDGIVRLKLDGDDPPYRALELSIKKWEFIVDYIENNNKKVDSGGTASCALCMIYRCKDCIVGRSGYEGCEGTPLYNFLYAGTYEWQLEAAIAEVAFLKTLRD